MSELVRYELRDEVAVVTMDDGKANALSHAMLGALDAAIERAEAEADALLLTGREGRFCAGFDLKTMMAGIESATELLRVGAKIYLRLYGLKLPLVVACNGHALAGGALLLLVGDVRIGAEGEFKIGLNEVAISIPLPVLALELARNRIASRYLTEATLLARVYTPDGAAEVGYLDRLASPEELFDEALSVAKELSGLPREPFAQSKAKLRGATLRHIRDTLAADTTWG